MRAFWVLLGMSLLTSCSIFPKYQTPFDVRNPLLDEPFKSDKESHLKDIAERFVQAYKTASENRTNATAITNYLDTGITYSHLLCKDYFDRLTFTKAHRDYVQKETNLVGGLASSLMGLAKASSGSVAATGAIFSFGEASFDTYNEAFIVSPDISALERLVLQKEVEEEALIYKKLNQISGNWPDRIETLDQAERALSGYINHCTINGIRTLLDTSVNERTVKVKNNVRMINKSQEKPSTLQTQ